MYTCEDYPCCGHEWGDCDGSKYGTDEEIKQRVYDRIRDGRMISLRIGRSNSSPTGSFGSGLIGTEVLGWHLMDPKHQGSSAVHIIPPDGGPRSKRPGKGPTHGGTRKNSDRSGP